MKSKITLFLISIIVFTCVTFGIVKTFNSNRIDNLQNDEQYDNTQNAKSTVSVEVTNNPTVDIVLSTKQTDVELDTFEADVKKALIDLGVDISNFRFQTVETVNTIVDNNSAANIINNCTTLPYNADSNWYYTNEYITTDVNEAYETGFIDKNNGEIANISLSGNCYSNEFSQPMGYILRIAPQKNNANRYNGYFLWVSGFDGYNKNQNPGTASASNISQYSPTKRVIALFRFEGLILDANIYDSYKTGSTYSATPLCATMYSGTYRFGWPYHSPRNYGGYPDGTLMQNGITVTNSGDSGLKTTTLGYSIIDLKDEIFNLGITAKGKNFTVTYNGSELFSATDENAFKKGYYGLFEYSHVNPRFYNLSANFQRYKEYKEILREPSWRNNAYHIVVNVDDEIDESLTGTDTVGEVLARTLENNIHFIEWGTDTNKESVENFIARNDNKGMFTQNSDYTNAVDKTAEYIKNLIENNSASQYVIAGENSNILVSPEELKTGATSVDYKDGRWRVHHNYTYFANDLGQSKNTEIYTPDLMFNFDKPGKYDIYFDDTLVKEVYAHRRPVADFKIRNNEGFMLTSTSYDLDDDEDIGYGKGIASEKWYYKKVNETDWIEGKMNNFIDIQENKYLVKLEVTDKQGETSYITKYLGAGKPIADFNYVESTITKYQDLEIKDISYDPLGKEITAWSWTLKKDGVEVGTYTERVPTVLNFNNEELGVGNYVYELVVTNSDGETSEVFKRGFTVTEDVTAPEVIIEPTSCDWRKFQKVEVIFSDKDSGFKNFKYAVDENIGISEETNWSEEIEETEYIVLIEEHGLKYLHIQALDNAGNLLERTVGIYKMDLVPPTGTYELTPPTEDRRAVLVTVTGEDDLSGVSRIILPDGTEVKGNTATYEVTVPGEYKALVVDKANNGTDVIIQVNVESEGVEAKYIDQVTGEEISPKEKITGGVGEIYNFVAKEIEGYTLVKEPSNAIGEFAFGKIEVVFEYRKVSKVTTKYINAVTGEEIIERVENTYKQGESYSEHAKEIGGYVLVEEASNKEGIVGDKDIEVIHRYKQLSGGVIVKYIDQVTGEALLQNIEIPGIEKTPYETEAKDITGYELVEIPSNATGEMGVDAIEVVYEYRKTSKVITKYIDASTKKEIIERTEVTYKEGERYTTTPQDKAEYILTKEPTNKEGIVGRNDIEVVYEYRKMSSGLIVKYIDYVSNEMLDEKIYEGNENDKIKLDIKEFEGYAIYIKPNKEEVSLTVSLQEVKIYYRKKVKLQIIGIDETTGEELYREEKEGIEGDTYKTEGREIGGYILERVPDNKNGVYLRSKTEVIYGYRKSSEGVKVTYIDRETGEILGEERINGLEGESYSVEIKEFDKYEYKDSEGNIEGKFKKELIEVKCYYEKKKGKVEVVYEDEEGNEIFKEELIGKVGERYKVEEKNIRNYSIKTRPEVTEGEYKEEKITVKYILTRLKGKVTVRIIDEKGKELDRIEQEGYAGDICYIRLPVYELYENTEEDQISIEYTDSEIVIEVIYKKIEKQIKPVEPTKPSNPENPNEPDRPIRRPYPLPDTSDINLWLYVKIFVISILVIALIIYIIKKVNKSKNKKTKK